MNDKSYFEKQFLNIINPLKKYYNGGMVQFAQHSAWYDATAADMEAFARPLWYLIPPLNRTRSERLKMPSAGELIF